MRQATYRFGSQGTTLDAAPNESMQGGMVSALSGKRVVIVEDEALTQMQLRRILTSMGLTVAGAAPNGQAGVDLVHREKPELVLMDINMPVMNGIEATQLITHDLKVCVVMLTAFSDEECRNRAALAGAAGYVVKPIDRLTLRPQLERAFHSWQNEKAN